MAGHGWLGMGRWLWIEVGISNNMDMIVEINAVVAVV